MDFLCASTIIPNPKRLPDDITFLWEHGYKLVKARNDVILKLKHIEIKKRT